MFPNDISDSIIIDPIVFIVFTPTDKEELGILVTRPHRVDYYDR